MNYLTIPHTVKQPYRFHQELLESLMVPYSASGSFSKEIRTRDGETILHQFSWATGMMYSGAEANYRKRFRGRIPNWIEELHPVLATRLFECSLHFGRQLPDENDLAVTSKDCGKALPNKDDLMRWADRYRVTDRWLELRLSRRLRQLVGADLMSSILAVLMDNDITRRDLILGAFRQIYEVDLPHDEPRARWAHEQLGGWFRKDIENAFGKTCSRWPFRHPDHALETTA